MNPLTLLLLLPSAAIFAQGPGLSCGSSLCFSGNFNDNGILQRAPEKSSYYGSATGSPAFAAISLTLAATDGSYTKTFSSQLNADNTWKITLDPIKTGGNYTTTVSCPTCTGSSTSITLYNQTFGDVFLCTGQSNAWLPVWFTFERNNSISKIASGEYTNIKMWFSAESPLFANQTGNWIQGEQGQRGTCLGKGRGPSMWCSGYDLVYTWMRQELNETQFEEAPALCWYFAQYLTDIFISNGETPPPIGMMSTPEGGTMIEQWSEFSSQKDSCLNVTCLCSTSNCNQSQPLDRTICSGNGGLYNAHTEPLLNTTIKGWLWLQGENNAGTDAGSSLHNTGYGCLLPTMVSQWRKMWSIEPGTTDPLAPFGIITIADGTEEGWGRNAYGLHQSQTANYGSLPNELIPNSFLTLAHDNGDPWDGYGCAISGCCVEDYIPLGKDCVGDHRGQWSVNNTPQFMGDLHYRSKPTMAQRVAEQAYATIYDTAGTSSAMTTGPVIQGCTIVSSNTLVLTFNASTLKGNKIVVSKPPLAKPMSLALENTATYVLVNNTLDMAFLEQNHHTGNNYKGSYSNGDEMYVQGWVAVLPSEGPNDNQITIDLSPLNGLTPTAIRYATGSGGWGSTVPNFSGCGRICCGPTLDCRFEPCPTNSCPIKAGPGELPAVPFVAQILNGKCKCVPPQICDD